MVSLGRCKASYAHQSQDLDIALCATYDKKVSEHGPFALLDFAITRTLEQSVSTILAGLAIMMIMHRESHQFPNLASRAVPPIYPGGIVKGLVMLTVVKLVLITHITIALHRSLPISKSSDPHLTTQKLPLTLYQNSSNETIDIYLCKRSIHKYPMKTTAYSIILRRNIRTPHIYPPI